VEVRKFRKYFEPATLSRLSVFKENAPPPPLKVVEGKEN
jgi:hypothetical protein